MLQPNSLTVSAPVTVRCPGIRPPQQMLIGSWKFTPASVLFIIASNLPVIPWLERPSIKIRSLHNHLEWHLHLVSFMRYAIGRKKRKSEGTALVPAHLPEITDSFQLSWSLAYWSRLQFSLFSSDLFLPSISPSDSLSMLDVRDSRPSALRFGEQRASFVWKLGSHVTRWIFHCHLW